jgi:3alpha(or 20beta)-hydroxysteroid dehydrogenase
MVAEGAKVVLADVLDDAGRSSAANLGAGGAYVHLDVSQEDQWSDAVTQTVERFGPITVLINNAGILNMDSLEDVDLDVYRRVIDVNQYGCLLGMRAVAPVMRAGGGGSIINTSSVAGLVGNTAIAYAASKWAIRGMTRSAALQLGPHGIRVNSIHPGTIDTPMIHADFDNAEGEQMRQSYAAGLPARRLGTVDDITGLALFLASDESAYCTGAEFIVDGGATCAARR